MLLLGWLNAVKEGRTPHSVLLCGPEGSGKKELARRAAAMYLKGTDDASVLAECPFFREYVFPEGKGQADLMRDCCAYIGAQVFGSGRHAVVFPDAHLLNESAQNILLKTLEEPPKDTLLLLTGYEEGLLPTIRSRCVPLRIGAASLAETAELLAGKGIDADTARLCASLSDGFPGRAEEMAGEAYMTFRKTALPLAERAFRGLVPYEETLSLCTLKEEGKKKASQKLAGDLLDIASSLLRDALSRKTGAARIFNTDEKTLIGRLSDAFTTARLQSMIKMTLSARASLGNNGAVKQVLDRWLTELSSLNG